MMPKGLLISFEGLDGSGKTTQVMMLGFWLQERGIDYIATREPGGTELGIAIRKLILEPPEAIDSLAEAFLFQADRAQHFAKIVLPSLRSGKVVITDRCFDSSIAYQGRLLDIEMLDWMSRMAMRSRLPHLTILLDLPAEQVRVHKNGQDRIDNESLEFHMKVRSAFLKQAKDNPKRIKIIDATQGIHEVHQEVVKLVEDLLARNC